MNFLKLINSFYYPKGAVELPTVVMIEPTDSCTLKCIMCDVQQQKNSNFHFLTFSQMQFIIDQFPAIRELIFCGIGEPLLNKDIFSMIEAAKKRKIPFVNLITNGELLEPDVSRKLIDAGLDKLHISISGVREDTFRKIRNNPKVSLEHLSENIKYICSRKKEALGKPRIMINIVMLDYNHLELKDMVSFCKGLGVDGICFIQLTTILGKKKGINVGRKGIPRLFKEIKVLGKKANLEIVFLTGNEYGRCYQLWDFIMIHSDGRISPCNGIMPTEAVIPDNIFDKNIKDIWLSESYNAPRRRVCMSSLDNCRFCESGYLIEGMDLKWLKNFYIRPLRNLIVKKIKEIKII